MTKLKSLTLLVWATLAGSLTVSCDSGLEDSPAPGILRVTLQSDVEDTSIIIVNDTLVVSQKDSFIVTIFQGRVYSDSNFALLFRDTTSFVTEDFKHNILALDDITGEYSLVVVYESFVPPIDYDRIQFGVTASLLKIGNFEVPVKLLDPTQPLIDVKHEFVVSENKVTEVNLRIVPFSSVTRFRDTFHFIPQIDVISVKYD